MIVLVAAAFFAGTMYGASNVNGYDIKKEHHKLQLESYHYCPYCGEKLENNN